tara:strand:+ start:3579 stop:4514 length:936 start_codon:yes stop_codon:yes gene_type:complete
MKILVTGGSGLVGNAIRNISEKYENYEFIFLSSKHCNLTDYYSTLDIFKEHNPDYVIHLAANVGGLYKNIKEKVQMLETNILININVLKVCHDMEVTKLISCLSTCIFPDKTTYPINEKMLHDGPPHHSNDAYAYAKRLLEIHSKSYREQYNDNFICIIPTNIYGEHDNYSLENAHVIPALIHKCYLAKKNNEKFIVRGSGEPLRQFIYSQDLAKLIMWTLEKYNDKDSLILSVNEDMEVSIKEIAMQIAMEFDYIDMIEFDTNYSDGQYKKTADNSKLINLLPNFKFTPISVGIKKSVHWFLDNYNISRK